jgi:hypothetical protein
MVYHYGVAVDAVTVPADDHVHGHEPTAVKVPDDSHIHEPAAVKAPEDGHTHEHKHSDHSH